MDLVQDTQALIALKDEWDDLLRDSAADNVFLTWEWLSTWWQNLSRDRKLHVLVARRDGRMVALAPLVVRPPGISAVLPFATLELMGTGSVGSDYLDIIVRRGVEAQALGDLADHLAGSRRAIELDQLHFGRSAAKELGALLIRKGWSVTEEETNVARYIDLSGHDWDSYLASLGSAHRYDFRRKLRKLGAEFQHRLDVVTGEEQRRAALERLFALHQARWRERGISNAFHTAQHLKFHEEFSRLACARGWIRMYTLWLDDEPVATLYGFRYGGVFSFYQCGFDPAYAKYSTGLLTMGLTIEKVIDEGAREFDMLQGRETYKARWAHASRPLGRLQIYPPHLRGLIYRRTIALSRAARKAVRTVLPKRITQAIAFGWAATYGRR